MLELNMSRKNVKQGERAVRVPVAFEISPEMDEVLGRYASAKGLDEEAAVEELVRAGLASFQKPKPWEVPGWKERMEEARKEMEAREAGRPSLKAVGVALRDTGKELVVTVGGAAYEHLQAGAVALSRTFVDPSTPADVFTTCCLLTDALTLGEDLGGAILDDAGFDRERPDREEMLAELRRNLKAVGLLKRKTAAKSVKKQATP